MPTRDYFSASYAEARAKFNSAAADAHAKLHAYPHPLGRDPNGLPLSIDVAFIGAREARHCLLIISGTHGVEGFAGSGCQVGFWRDRLYDALGRDGCAVVVHALNPYGFAWLRRVNEDNVDLNRNFQDFSRALPANEAYDSLHEALVPTDWEGPARPAADAVLQKYIARHGVAAFQTAVTAGQYTHPTGLFYGGTAPTWSARTFKALLETHVPSSVARLVAIDLHTGLGPYGYGEPIFVGPSTQFERAKTRFGPELKNLASGTSASSVLSGTIADAVLARSAACDATFLGLEFGTRPMAEVLNALRADHWLHSSAGQTSALRAQIAHDLRDAFFVDAAHWQSAVYGRMADFVLRSCRVLGEQSM